MDKLIAQNLELKDSFALATASISMQSDPRVNVISPDFLEDDVEDGTSTYATAVKKGLKQRPSATNFSLPVHNRFELFTVPKGRRCR